MVDGRGLEPQTSGLQPNAFPVKLTIHNILATYKGIEPLSPDRQSGIITFILISHIDKWEFIFISVNTHKALMVTNKGIEPLIYDRKSYGLTTCLIRHINKYL